MDPNQGGEQEGEEELEGTRRSATKTTRMRRMPRGPLSPFPRRRRQMSPGLLPPPLLEMIFDQYPYQFGQTTKHKDDNNK